MKGQVAVAFVAPAAGVDLNEAELTKAVIAAVGKGMTPSRIHIVPSLPKTRNGKLMRRVIRARYLGERVGDLSSLDPLTPIQNIPVKE
jgi:acetyl-CoA synthetase